jgi:hypothetical protein
MVTSEKAAAAEPVVQISMRQDQDGQYPYLRSPSGPIRQLPIN